MATRIPGSIPNVKPASSAPSSDTTGRGDRAQGTSPRFEIGSDARTDANPVTSSAHSSGVGALVEQVAREVRAGNLVSGVDAVETVLERALGEYGEHTLLSEEQVRALKDALLDEPTVVARIERMLTARQGADEDM